MAIAAALLAERLTPLFEASVAAGEVPGVVALVTDAHADRWVGAFGERRQGGGVPMTADTIGWIASMTKPLTTAAVLQLVERGRLDLDAPASRWLPAIGAVPVLEGFDASGAPMLRRPRREVTLRHLLTHTGGFGYEFWSEALQRHQALRAADAGGAEHRFFSFPMLFDPGTRWNYGVGIDWAGRVVEAVSGLRLGEWFARHLTGPLDMRDTRFGVAPQSLGRTASMHQRVGSGRFEASTTAPPAAPPWDIGGGGLFGTLPDYGCFIRMILNEGRHGRAAVLGRSSVEHMRTNQIGELRSGRLCSVMPQASGDAEFLPGVAKGWTFGFQINLEPAPTGRPAGGLAWAGLSNCYFWIDPVNRIGGALMAQILPFADAKVLALFETFERAVYACSGRAT